MGENHQHLVDQHTTQTQVEDKSRYATTTTTTLHQSKHKYKYTMKITGLIASTFMLLLVVMTSTASALSIERPPSCEFETRLGDSILVEELMHVDIKDNKCCWFGQLEHKSKCYQNTPKPCCRAFTLECEACNAGVTEEEFCRRNPHHQVCPQKPDNKPSHPDNCYSSIWNTEIRHGETGAKKCCWYESGSASLSARRTHQSLILIAATPPSGTPKSCMVRWVPRSAAGMESGSASLSAVVVTRMIKLFCFCDYALFLKPFFPSFSFDYNQIKCTLCKITM